MIRAEPIFDERNRPEFPDLSIMPPEAEAARKAALAAVAADRRECGCEFWATPWGPEPNAVVGHDGDLYCGDCGGWLLDVEE